MKSIVFLAFVGLIGVAYADGLPQQKLPFPVTGHSEKDFHPVIVPPVEAPRQVLAPQPSIPLANQPAIPQGGNPPIGTVMEGPGLK